MLRDFHMEVKKGGFLEVMYNDFEHFMTIAHTLENFVKLVLCTFMNFGIESEFP